MNPRTLIIVSGVLGALAVSLGAFGAHALEPFLQAAGRLDTYETAVGYHFYHTLLLLAIAMLSPRLHPRISKIAAWLVFIGILIFSGTLYVLCLTGITWLGAITPVGGLCLIAGWVLVAVSAAKTPLSK